ncbi:MAG: calcium-binding protein, partial [Pseudomonadota bacterium]
MTVTRGTDTWNEFALMRPRYLCECNYMKAPSRQPLNPNFNGPLPRRDPLLLDLTGEGIQTLGLEAGIHFDHDGNGFMERTGWADLGTGVLMLDRNGSDSLDTAAELFGDFALLSNGMMAFNGFEALSQYDHNNDGTIDAADPIWAQLRIWQHHSELVYSYVPSMSGTISSLDELGIAAIHLDSETVNEVDAAGNTEVRTAHFEWNDGSTGAISEYSFQRDLTQTEASELLEVSPEIDNLPDLFAFGNVYSLHQAMARDLSGALTDLVQSFVSETDASNRSSILHQIIFKWTGSDSVTPDYRGPFIDGRKVASLENLYGQSLEYPNSWLAAWWEDTYRQIFEGFYADLMVQTHLKDLFELVWCGNCEETNTLGTDMSVVAYELSNRLATDPEQGRVVLSEFARSLRGLELLDTGEYLAFRESFIQIDPDLAWIFDTGGLPVYNQLGQSPDGWYFPHMFGTWNSDAVQGSATQGDGWINGLDGDDAIYGTDRNEKLANGNGDSIIVAGGGNDTIWAGPGADILDGGAHDDLLIGEAGDYVYLFRPGSGHDVIRDITLKRSGNYLVLEIIATGDTIAVEDFFRFESYLKRVEQIQFMDGTTWDETEMIARAYAPTNGPDRIYGGPGEDELSGLGGADLIYGLEANDTLHGDDDNDRLYGGPGADTLIGGAGADRLAGEADADVLIGGLDDDYLDGGSADDTYRFGPGFGKDTIHDMDATPGNIDTIEFEAGILPTDVKLRRADTDLELTILGTGDTITVEDWLVNDTPVHGIELVTFTDGTVWDTATMQDMLVKGTDAADTIIGFSGADTIEGYGSNDTIYARGGDDFVDSGSGNDVVYAEQGNDTVFAGDGNDTVVGGFGSDFLDPGSGEDRLYGGERPGWGGPIPSNGNDTYFFSIGYGNDIILDHDRTAGNIDTIKLGDGIAPGDIRLTQTGEDLTLFIKDTTDILTVQNWFWNDSPEYRVEQIEFSDGTVWDVAAVKQQVIQGTPGDDLCIGYSTSDTISAYEGNDRLYGRQGDDTLLAGPGDDEIWAGIGADDLSGGLGEDTLVAGDGDDSCDPGEGRDVMYGGSMHEAHELYFTADRSNGNDTYLFGRDYGRDEIFDRDAVAGNLDTIVLGEDIIVADVNVRHVDDDLVLAVVGTGDTLTVHNWFLDDSTEWQIERIQFADGTVWDV